MQNSLEAIMFCYLIDRAFDGDENAQRLVTLLIRNNDTSADGQFLIEEAFGLAVRYVHFMAINGDKRAGNLNSALLSRHYEVSEDYCIKVAYYGLDAVIADETQKEEQDRLKVLERQLEVTHSRVEVAVNTVTAAGKALGWLAGLTRGVSAFW